MRVRSLVTATGLAVSGLLAPAVVGAGFQASAACPEVGQVSYSFSGVSKAWLPTSLRSDYLTGPGSITFSRNTTSSVNASITGTTSAEAGVIFAKASVSIGITVGASYSRSDTWSYTANVPSGQTKRLQQFKEARKMTVKKTQIVAPCNVKTVWTKTATAPVKSNTYKWTLVS
ncbi:hypothetical protein ALI144C_35800 [Actinosynnema sp. ALI-1.44]|uniref:hypothetical protein n=1 Tax=Actinosynnema sp. ALI-1.44 TaxID=1933779 RepID=UPI00097C4305|nr:hypothetical protein [Actinosynnema sp. ALI-1.44]ONI76067.1 hypothetical protein ALI144C_35800 [Actinosynnema sp. ALI-1.44]